ncbi:hypothetical protein ART_2670 [Arthrobacter sp. PAMC 25486]|uniref:WxL protein peptidoglycan domain-containing protein n=1 Tax=Arthrobacter sp. PAMC 25486 TaxID=1494608 RepID=UPI0005361B4E|nr:DUF916 domain-containing protein [Arthrobacter sp. PAMC 25486]AIY02269.1 hypothetical protein ART_2670 [Arthrobacter sp. PAMC 25486]
MRFPTRTAHECPRAWLALLAAVLISVMALLLAPAPAQATSGDDLSWSVKPGGDTARTNFSYEMDAGGTQHDSFVVTNLGAKAFKLAVYAADGTTSTTGALDLLPATEASTGIGAWVTVETPTIELAPGAQADVPFTVAVPADAEPGDYVGGLLSSYVDIANGGTVQVDRRLATRMNVRVAGDGRVSMALSQLAASTGLAWNPFAPVPGSVAFEITNSGNVRARGPYTVTMAGPFGWGKRTTTIASAELIPGGSAAVATSLEGVWPLGWLTTTVEMSPEGIDGVPGTAATITTDGWAVPWGQFGLLAVIVAAAICIGLWRGRSAKKELP